MHNTMPINVGDWVYSDSPGIWQVYRILEEAERMRSSLQERKRVRRDRLVFSKRFVDEGWKPAFANEVASSDLLRPLSDDDRRYLEEFIARNPQTLQEFKSHQPKGIDLVRNLPLNVPTSVKGNEIQRLAHDVFSDIGENGLTNDDILQRIATSELVRYTPKTIRNATLQFICKDHELRGNEYVFREAQVIMV